MDQNNLDRLLTATELAHKLGIPSKRVRRAIRSGELRAFRIGHWFRVRENDAAAWINGRRYQPSLDTDREARGAR